VIAVARTADLVLMMLDATKPYVHRQLLEKELESVGIRLNKMKPNIYFKVKKGGGLSFNSTCQLTKVDEKMVQMILHEYKLFNAEDCSADELIDVILGNRVYLPCIYVYNKIDQISIQEVDRIARQPNSVVVSAHRRDPRQPRVPALHLRVQQDRPDLHPGGGPHRAPAQLLLIDVILGNRVYLPCIYVYNKIDQISIQEVDRIARQPNSVVVSAHRRDPRQPRVPALHLRVQQDRPDLHPGGGPHRAPAQLRRRQVRPTIVLIDVILGNRVYLPCIYVYIKIDQISIQEVDRIARQPNSVVVSAHRRDPRQPRVPALHLRVQQDRPDLHPGGGPHRAPAQLCRRQVRPTVVLIDVILGNRVYLPCIYVYIKIDQISIQEVGRIARQPNSVVVSCNMKLNLDYLLETLWEYLSLIRGVTIEHVCHSIHRSLVAQLKYALVWGISAKYSPQRVGIRHTVSDEDVVQLIKK
ncbi:Developmentally-regulated GTP-binding protein 2, partial [Operophtera brumata]